MVGLVLREGTKLLNYQIQDVRYLAKHPRSANFNDCGLGKTLEELVVIAENTRHTNDEVLVFCPKSCLVSWADEVEKHTTLSIPGDVQIVTGTRDEKEIALQERAKIYLTNYETSLTNFDHIVSKGFHHIVLDESTRVKNPKALSSRAITAIADRAETVRIMSGLPMPQNPTEIFSQFRILDSGETFGQNYNHFRAIWFKKKGKWPALRWELKSELKKRFAHLISEKSIRRLRSSVIELPPITTTRRIAEWHDLKVAEEYLNLETTIRDSMPIRNGMITNLNHALVKATKLSQYSSGFLYDDDGFPHLLKDNPKIRELRQLLHDYNVFERKITIVGIFRPELAMVFNLCAEMGLNPVLIHGDTVAEDRAKRIETFRSDPACRVLVANQKTISYGLNLQFCNTIIFYGLSFSIELYKQLCDRIHRIGQKKNCLLVHLLVSGTFDLNRYRIVVNGLDSAEEFMKFIGGIAG
jgi:SNF2 family DNA or RNA helicase